MESIPQFFPPQPPLTFLTALTIEVAALQAEYPKLADRLSQAQALLSAGRLFVEESGTEGVAISADTVDPTTGEPLTYHVNGACTCAAAQHNKPCKHRVALHVYQRVVERMHGFQSGEPTAPGPQLEIDPRFIVTIQEKPFVKFAGLLQLAHKRGLQSLRVDWTYNDADLSLAHAVAVFPFGTFEESGDATETNVNKKVAPHFRRVSLTRAAARALRWALGIDMCALEELEQGE